MVRKGLTIREPSLRTLHLRRAAIPISSGICRAWWQDALQPFPGLKCKMQALPRMSPWILDLKASGFIHPDPETSNYSAMILTDNDEIAPSCLRFLYQIRKAATSQQ